MPPAKHDPPAHLPGFVVSHRVTLLLNRYEIRALDAHGGPGELLAVAQQKRRSLKEQVTFYTDEQRTQPVFSFKARQVLDRSAGYDVFDERGEAIGFFRKDFTRSLTRSTFELSAPYLQAVGQERSSSVAVLRRFFDLPLAFHFDFVEGAQLVMSIDRRLSIRDRYAVTVPDRRLDFRVAAAMAVGLETLMRR